MKKSLIAILLLCAAFCMAQTPSQQKSAALEIGNPAEVGMSPERIAKIDEMLSKEVSNGNIPGAVALIARKGKIVLHKAYGTDNGEIKRPLGKDAIFRIASQTKAITATAVMMLWEEGKFKLDDKISKYIPEFGEAQILDSFNEADSTYTTTAAENQITIRQLLTHTSGIGYGMIDGDERFRKMYAKAGIIDAFTSKKVMLSDNIKKLATLPLHHEPGESWTYSEGLDVLGYLIEVVSGQPFDVFLQQHIFEPLGMSDTWFYLPKDKQNRLVAVQVKDEDIWKRFTTPVFDIDYPKKGAMTYFSGGAGLSSTALDYATFLQMYLNGGVLNGTRLLSRTTVNIILSNQIGDIWKGGKGYGLAFEVVNEKGEIQGGEGSAGTFDWGGYFNTQYFADPNEDIIGILLKQTQGPVSNDNQWKFRQMVFAAIDD